MESVKPQILLQARWLWKKRPAHIFRAARCYLQFYFAYFFRILFAGVSQGIALGDNVRLQKNGVLMAEAPDARISIGHDSVVYENAKIEAYGSGAIYIGQGAVLGDIKIIARHRIQIGDRFLSSWNVFIQDYDSHPLSQSARKAQVKQMTARFQPNFRRDAVTTEVNEWGFPGEDVVIGDDVWIGANSTILKGVRIGSGSVVAAGSVVVRGDYPARSLIGGNPARVIKELPE